MGIRVLQLPRYCKAPAPIRRDSVRESSTKESSTRVGTPDSVKGSSPTAEKHDIVQDDSHELAAMNKPDLPISFGAVATSVPDTSTEVSVSA